MRRAPAILLAMMLWAMPAQAATAQEQEELLEESLAIIASELGGNYDHLGHLVLPSRNGGQLELAFGRDDPGFGASAAACIHEGDPGRQHPLGSTVLTELRVLDSATLQRFLEDNQDKAPKGNVSSSFLVHHWRALQLSARADDIEGLRVALLEEARSLSYLMDAFSSSNFFFPGRDPLDWLHSVNNRERRRAFQFMGAYVMDSRGEVWQSFGDGLLQWHPKSLEMVELAVLAALREFFAVYYGESAPLALATWRDEHSPRDDALAWVASWLEPSDGVVFYQEHRMPSLLHIPMAISATWSERDPSRVEHGIASRFHWPQLKDTGGHDPDLTAQLVARLPAGDELPTWLHFPLLKTSSPSRLLLENPDVASVRFEQQVSIPPTFKGGLLVFGLGSNLRGENSTWLLSGGLGWGIADAATTFAAAAHLPEDERGAAGKLGSQRS